MSLKDKLQKSFLMADEDGYEVYRNLAFDPNDKDMFVSKEEIDQYFEQFATV